LTGSSAASFEERRMTFDELLEQVIDSLQRQGRVSYGVLKRRFAFTDDYRQDLKIAALLIIGEGGEPADFENLVRRLLLDPANLSRFASLPLPALGIDILQLRHQILLTTRIRLFEYSRSRDRLPPGGRRAGLCQLAL
jgi:hypothetical protein